MTLAERIKQMNDALAVGDELRAELLERATYLHAMEPEGLSTIELQSMHTMYRAADQVTCAGCLRKLRQSDG
jgi:hypothetical protein